MPVRTFLDEHDLKARRFCRSAPNEGSGLARTMDELRDALPDSDIRPGLPVLGSTVQHDPADAGPPSPYGLTTIPPADDSLCPLVPTNKTEGTAATIRSADDRPEAGPTCRDLHSREKGIDFISCARQFAGHGTFLRSSVGRASDC